MDKGFIFTRIEEYELEFKRTINSKDAYKTDKLTKLIQRIISDYKLTIASLD